MNADAIQLETLQYMSCQLKNYAVCDILYRPQRNYRNKIIENIYNI